LDLPSVLTERFGEKWEVTKVVTKENLGEPKERLNEKMWKLQLLSGNLCHTEKSPPSAV